MNQKTTDMKKLTGFLFVSVSLSSIAQSLTPTVVSSTGDYYVGSAATLSWTLGEVVTDTYNGTSNQLTQGFHQPDLRFSIIEDLATEMTLNLFPNPTNGLVSFEIKNNFDALNIAILDPAGRIIYTSSYAAQSVLQIDLSTFANGIYYMQVTTESNQKIKTLKIEKL
mgnify:CR=1 FL=1|jgi:hypothetical protein